MLTAKAPEGEGNATLVPAEDKQLPSQRWRVRHKKDGGGNVVQSETDTRWAVK